MFKGIHNINLDGKGRLTMPTKYRNTISDQSGNNMVVTIDSEEKCLLLYPATIFSNIEKEINKVFPITIFNSDGNEISACGNGSRCVAYLLSKDLNIKKN